MSFSELQIFWSNLEKIKDQLLINDVELAKILGMPHSLFDKCKVNQTDLPLNCVVELAEKINVHIEDLLSKDFKLSTKLLESKLHFQLDERYDFAKHSTTRPIANILDFLERFVHPRMRFNVLRKFQLSEEFISNPNSEVNMFLILDILNYLKTNLNFTAEQFFLIGQRTPFLPQNKGLIQALKKIESPIESLEYFIEDQTKQFDTNFKYEILKKNNMELFVGITPNQDVADELRLCHQEFGSEEGCLTKLGILSSITYFNQGLFLPVKKTKSLYQNDSMNIYKVDLSPLYQSSNLFQLNFRHTAAH